MAHMKNNDIYSKKQFSFLSGRSTGLTLTNVVHKWTVIRYIKGCAVYVAYCDIMNACDTVPHRSLHLKLKNYNIGRDLLA